jgi:endonuclease III
MSQKKIYAYELSIDLSSKQEAAYFKWFLACLLFGKPIQQEVAKRTYLEFVNEGFTTPDAIIQAGWDKLVEVLDKGHYVRFDYSTATKLLDVCKALKEKYGTITNLLKQSQTLDELSSRLQDFKGVGPKTVEIFLRDMAPVFSQYHQVHAYSNASKDQEPSTHASRASKKLRRHDEGHAR